MAGARIMCPIYTVNLDSARSDLVALWLARLTLESADPGRFLCGHLLYIFVFFSAYIINYFLQVIVRALGDKKMGPVQNVCRFMVTYIKTFNEVLPLI